MSTDLVKLFSKPMNPSHIGTGRSGNQNVVCISCGIRAGFHECSSYEFLLIRVLLSAVFTVALTKSYFSTTELNLVAKHSLAVPSATDFSNSSKNLRYTLCQSKTSRTIPYGSLVSFFTERSPPLHPFWQFGQLWERINKPFTRRGVAKKIVNRPK